MVAVAYPSSLPMPQAGPLQSRERRARSPAGGPYEVRALSRQWVAEQQITLPPLDAEQTATFWSWYHDDLFDGGASWGATWPLPQGIVPSVRRFLAPPRLEFLPTPKGNFWRITFPCEVSLGEPPELPVSPFVDCDLLLHFDEADPSEWLDYSQFRRALVIAPGVGTIAGDASAGEFSRGALVTNPNAGTNADVAHPTMTAAGRINFGSSNFFISLYIDTTAGLPGNAGNFIFLSCQSADFSGGWLCQISTNGSGTQSTLEFSFTTAAGLDVKHANIDITGVTGRHLYQCSRKGDQLSTFVDRAHYASSNSFTTGQAIDDSTANVIRLFSLETDPGHLIAGFKGGMDEVYINHGPAWGFNAADDGATPTGPF